MDGANKAAVVRRRNAPRRIRRGRHRKEIMAPRILPDVSAYVSLARPGKKCDAIRRGSRKLHPQRRALQKGCREKTQTATHETIAITPDARNDSRREGMCV